MMQVAQHNPTMMTAEDRLNEIARILAAGYRRLLGQKAKNGLDDLVPESPHGNTAASTKDVA